MQHIEPSNVERENKQWSAANRAAAAAIMRTDGIICLRNVIKHESINLLHARMQADLDQRTPSRTNNAWNSLRPPPFHPYLFEDIVYNAFAIDVCHDLLGPEATLTTYGANTSWPGQDTPQKIHRDVPDGVIGDRCPAVVLNIPLTTFSEANGATVIYPGSHRAAVDAAAGTRQYTQAMLDSRAAVRPPERTVGIGPGDLVVRDLRLWHGGMPNPSQERRIMLALVVIDPDYHADDESGFKGFEAERGSEAFWNHPRLATAVSFVEPNDRTYYLHGHHSTPPTTLRADYERRKPNMIQR